MTHLAKLQALLLVGLGAACVLPAQAQLANNLTIGNPKAMAMGNAVTDVYKRQVAARNLPWAWLRYEPRGCCWNSAAMSSGSIRKRRAVIWNAAVCSLTPRHSVPSTACLLYTSRCV